MDEEGKLKRGKMLSVVITSLRRGDLSTACSEAIVITLLTTATMTAGITAAPTLATTTAAGTQAAITMAGSSATTTMTPKQRYFYQTRTAPAM